MRTLLLFITTILITTSVSSQNLIDTWPLSIKFESVSQDIGVIQKGRVVKIEFPFVNDGTEPLIISPYKGGTEDINIILPKEPVAPGKKGKIIVEYTARKSGRFNEKLSLNTNAQKKPGVLEFYGTIK